jgi:hypothetical protein
MPVSLRPELMVFAMLAGLARPAHEPGPRPGRLSLAQVYMAGSPSTRASLVVDRSQSFLRAMI